MFSTRKLKKLFLKIVFENSFQEQQAKQTLDVKSYLSNNRSCQFKIGCTFFFLKNKIKYLYVACIEINISIEKNRQMPERSETTLTIQTCVRFVQGDKIINWTYDTRYKGIFGIFVMPKVIINTVMYNSTFI